MNTLQYLLLKARLARYLFIELQGFKFNPLRNNQRPLESCVHSFGLNEYHNSTILLPSEDTPTFSLLFVLLRSRVPLALSVSYLPSPQYFNPFKLITRAACVEYVILYAVLRSSVR